jgi:hypothetical protein
MAVLIVVMAGKVADWVPGLWVLPLAKIAFLFAAISALRNHAQLTPVRIRSLRVARPALAFMTLAILSITFSIYKSATFAMSQLVLIVLLSMALLLKVTQTPRDLERIMVGFIGAAASLAVGLILNFQGGRAVINGNFDPNEIAYALDTLLPLVLAYRQLKRGVTRLAVSGLALLMILSVLLTGSRGGAIGLILVVLAVVAFPIRLDAKRQLPGFSVGKTLGRVVIVVAAFALAWGYLPTPTRDRMATLLDLSSDYNADPTLNASRTVIWRRDIGLALERPIGYGMGTAELVDGLNGGQYRTAHNSLVQAFVELGALGLYLYVFTFISAWKELVHVARLARQPAADEQAKRMALYARALNISLLANMGAGFFLSQAYDITRWMVMAVIAAIIRLASLTPASKAAASGESCGVETNAPS